VVYAAIMANAAIAVAKFIVAGMSGSSAILSEGIHSTVDTLNECLLLLGIHRSRVRPDEAHPFGHGKELYFWSLMVAVLLFGLGGGMAIYEGITHLLHPRPTQSLMWTYVVLGIAAIFEGYSFVVAFRALGAQSDGASPLKWWHRVRRSKDPSVFSVFVEDFAALTGIVIALLGVTLGTWLGIPSLDGVASLLIGATLTAAAVVLAHETRNLLVGESARPETVRNIFELVESEPGVRTSQAPLTMQLGPDQILVNIDLDLQPELSAREQLELLERISARIREQHPQVVRVSLNPVLSKR
jgi:cation diffusion facilitator family transporter